MIKYITGNLFDAQTEALVNTVNTVGVMGKGIALQFKKKYPHNYKIYKDACKSNTFKTGQVLVVKEGDLLNQKLIINFPTKAHWRSPSRYEYITTGLSALKTEIAKSNIKSIAIPPLGCGNGGLEWAKVKVLIEEALSEVDCEIYVYTPNKEIKAILQQEKTKKRTKLTPARAMLLHLLFQHEAMGESSSLFVANKVAWFLQRRGEKLRLNFKPHFFGPYAVQLNHVLLDMNGVYLKGMEQNEVKPFESLQLNYQKEEEVNQYVRKELSFEQQQRLNDVLKLLRGFESMFSLELLSSVDYLIVDQPNKELDKVIEELSNWSKRKREIFQSHQIEIAYKHLQNYSNNLLPA